MKSIVILLLSSFALVSTAFAQKGKDGAVTPKLPMDATTNLYTYVQVVEVSGVTKDELYKRALAWANGFYKNPGDVIREKNPEEGKILIKARFRISNEPDKKGVVTQAGDVMYSLSLSFKNDRYRYEITKINWQQTSYFPAERWHDTNSPSYKPAYAYYLKQTDAAIKAVVADFTKKMAEPVKAKSSDW